MRCWVGVMMWGALGCAESRFDEMPPAQQNVDLLPPVDTFWLQESVAEATKPPLQRPRSISLGYVGDTPLTGGVMRDTPMPVMLPYPMPVYCPVQPYGYMAPVQ